MNELIGINFSTRNRPDTLEICLLQLYKHLSPDKYRYVISVVNDQGDAAWNAQYDALKLQFPDVHWLKAQERLGIARTKNCGIQLLNVHHCDHYFLFDDDAFPVKPGWEELYIHTARLNDIHHLMHQFPLPGGFDVQRSANGICEYDQCCGILLYFTSHALATVGGYRKNFGVYGFEHAELTLRTHHAGLQPGWGPFISPEKTREYIYSFDLDWNNWAVQPPDFSILPHSFRSSVSGEDVQSYIRYNEQFLHQRHPVFEEIEQLIQQQ